MIFLLPILYNFLILLSCGGLLFQTLTSLNTTSELVDQLSEADFKLLTCAQNEASRRNIHDAYTYLKTNFPYLRNELRSIKDTLDIEDEIPCIHPVFTNLQSAARQQSREKYPDYWPNWVLASEEIPQ